jgi:PAS domain S-box-containing protein
MEDIPLEVNRYGFTEETHFTIAYSPVPDEAAPRGIGGVLATVHEITEKVVGERRTMALRDLGAAVLEERNAQEACLRAAEILANYPRDIPFSLVYLLDEDQKTAHLACCSGLEPGAPLSPESIIVDQNQPTVWPFRKTIETKLVNDLKSLGAVPAGPWSDPPGQAAVVPIHSNTAHQLAGFLVAGLSPRLRYDDSYRGFLDLASSQIATALANARAYEEERKRAEALAEIDRFGGTRQVAEWLGAAKNVSARREAEEALRQSEQRLRLITEASPILEFVGRTLEQETGNGWLENVHPDDLERSVEIYVSAFDARRPFQMEYRLRHRSGQYRWILDSAVPRYASDGTFEGYVGGCLDIHEQKEASDARSRLAAIVESSDDAIISKDLNGIVTSWNRRAEYLFGYKEEEMVGRSILTIIPPEFHRDEDMILSRIREGQKIDHFETVRVTKSGEKIDVSLSISPVRDGNRNIVGAAKIARDIRESKKIERALRTTEKLAAAGRLAATVAHEINNPLEAVSNLVFLARHDSGNADKVSEYLQMAERELGRVAHIARQTLGFYRETSAPTRFGVVKAIDELLFLYEKRLESRNIRVTRQYQDNIEITAFAGELRQAFSNLISNAIDAMPSGGSLIIRVSQTREWSNSSQPGVRVTILDTGSGIPSHARKSLFEPFFTTKLDVGTGLGLWVTKSIVEKHHGTIRFISSTAQQKHGTAFSIFLPLNINIQHDEARPRQDASTAHSASGV